MNLLELDSNEGATVFRGIKIERKHPAQTMSSLDLENHVSQAAWKFFTHCRSDVAQRLGIGEMDLVITDVRIVGVRIDGHQVINPSGFTGRQLDIRLAISMAKQGVIGTQGIAVEGGSVRAFLLSEEEEIDHGYYIEVDQMSRIFIIDKDGIAHLVGFDWGLADVVGSVSEALSLPEETAFSIYKKYSRGEVSERLVRRLDKSFFKSIGALTNAVFMSLHNQGEFKGGDVPPVYLRAAFPVPDKLYRKQFTFGNRKFKFEEPKGEYDIHAFLENSMHGIYEDLNELARRRIKWATPSEPTVSR